jgi:hypothetical protein
VLDHDLGRTMMSEAFRRGSTCDAAFDDVDLLAMANWELADVRHEFSIPPFGSA